MLFPFTEFQQKPPVRHTGQRVESEDFYDNWSMIIMRRSNRFTSTQVRHGLKRLARLEGHTYQ